MRGVLGVLACVVVLALAGCGGGSSHSSVTTGAVDAQMRRAAQSFMTAHRFPGLAVGVWWPRGTFVQGLGIADAASGTPMSPGDYFRIGSITKTFTATVILQLVQQGKLSLSDPLSKFEPQIPHSSQITIRELLNHTSGLRTGNGAVTREAIQHPQTPVPARREIAATVRQPLLSPPGQTYHYSDVGYEILGEVAAKVTHTALGTLIQRQVIAPLGLSHTAYAPNPPVPPPAAHGYLLRAGRQLDTSGWSYAYTSSAGSMVSTVGDLKTYAAALATGSGLLSPATQQERMTFVPTNIPGVSYGLGILEIGPFLGHDGEVTGYNSIMLYSPAQRITVVVLGSTSPTLNQPADPNGEVVQLAAQLIGLASRG